MIRMMYRQLNNSVSACLRPSLHHPLVVFNEKDHLLRLLRLQGIALLGDDLTRLRKQALALTDVAGTANNERASSATRGKRDRFFTYHWSGHDSRSITSLSR